MVQTSSVKRNNIKDMEVLMTTSDRPERGKKSKAIDVLTGKFKWVFASLAIALSVGSMLSIALINGELDKGYRFVEESSDSALHNFEELRNPSYINELPIVEEDGTTTSIGNENGIQFIYEYETVSYPDVTDEEVPELEIQEPKFERWYPPKDWSSTRLSYMDYRTITAEGTLQWELQNDGWTSTDPNTGIRMRGGRYMIALGQEFGLTGTKVNIYLENGAEIQAVVGDSKEYFDTIDGEGRIGADTGIVEFIVEEEYLPDDVIELGSNELQFNGYWQSPVAYIDILDE